MGMEETFGTEASDIQQDGPPAADPAPSETSPLDGLDLRGLAEHLRPTAEAPAPEPDGEDGEDGEEADELPPAAETVQPKTQRTVDEWETLLAKEPHRINEAPGRLRMELYERAQKRVTEATKTAREQAYREGLAEAQRLNTLAAEVAQIDEVRESDPAKFGQWASTYPDRFAAYQRAKGDIERAQRPPDPALDAEIDRRASAIIAPLVDHPEIAEKLATRTYPRDLDGLTRLSADVAAEMARLEAAPIRKREQAAAANAAKPKAIVPGGGGGQGELTAATLKNMTPEQIIELRNQPGGRERVERAALSR